MNQVGTDTPQRLIEVNQGVLSKNDVLAQRNRALYQSKGLLVLNVVSSPGSGKTALIERMLTDLQSSVRGGVIVGDLATDNDARRIQRTGSPAVQIVTGDMCHLEAEMVAHAAEKLNLDELDLLIIENVGNLVCPAGYDLGEALRVVLFSVTEGEDKPLKYPIMFKSAHVVIISKIDLADAAGFDRALGLDNVRRVAPQATIFEASSRTGQGMNDWYAYLRQHMHQS